MSIPPESVEVGKCYRSDTGYVRKVVRITHDGRVHFEIRTADDQSKHRQLGMQDVRSFAFQAEREVSCDWTPDKDG